MNSAHTSLAQATTRLQQLTAQLWSRLSHPRWLLILIPPLLLVLGLTLFLPQQSVSDFGSALSAETIWLNSLPGWLTGLGRPLYSLGFSQLLSSFWFWIPAALLLGHSLIALAHYGPASWQRFREETPTLQRQHPFSERVEQSVRLSDNPDEQLETLGEALSQMGYLLDDTSQAEPDQAAEQRQVIASRRRWAWLGPLIFYSGLLLLIGAFFISTIALERDRLTLNTDREAHGAAFNGSFMLTSVDAAQETARVTFRPTGGQAAKILTWRTYRPTWLGSTLIFPTALETLLTITAQDEAGALLTITALQVENPASQRLTVPRPTADEPLLFSIPNTALAFQLTPTGSSGEPLYNLQVRQGAEATLIADLSIRLGQPIPVEGLTLIVSPSYKLQALTWRDPAFILYVFSLVLLLTGLLAYARPPATIWLIPEVKGRGGQLYGVLEGFGAAAGLSQILEHLLETPPEEDAAAKS